ncbi:MAG: hypothetical protein H0V15_03250 [Solirubrobacterales bacterium]|nr:hypothetical protein [Solirubrobacterales bacterium]
MDFSRLRQGEIVAGIGGIALIVFLFFDWFQGTDGWSSLASPEVGGGVTGFIVALAGVTAVKFTALALMGKRLNIPVPRGGITLVLGSLAVLIIIWTLLVAPEGAEVKAGLILGLAAAVAITVGALMALRESGWEPLVNAGGTAPRSPSTATTRSTTTTRTAASSSSTTRKPAATTRPSRKKTAAKKRAAKRSATS